MKTWIKRSLIGLAAASVLFGGMAAWAHKSHRAHWQAMTEQDMQQMKVRLIEKAGSKLDLDEAQKAKLGLLADAVREQRAALIGSTTNPRAELQGLFASPTFDRAKASALIEAKVGAISGKSPAVVNALADFYDSLKPAQQDKLRGYMARGGSRHSDRRDGGGQAG
jgi:periplasmic protein CpxP/Spy